MPIGEYYVLRLFDGEITFLENAEGGCIYAEVVSEHSRPQGCVKKHIGKPQYGAFTLQVGSTLSRVLFDWIAASWQSPDTRRDGAVLVCDTAFTIRSERRFSHARIERVEFSALDSSSEEPGYLTVRIAPENSTIKTGAGKLALDSLGQHQLWRTSNFRLEIDGLETDGVTRIEPFAVRQIPGSKVSRIDFPDLEVSLSQPRAQSWIDWHQQFVIEGYNGERYEKEGAIRFLAPDSETELARIDLHNLGIFRLAYEPGDGNGTGGLRAGLYCEWMEIHLGEAES
jgi:hypothetical protein